MISMVAALGILLHFLGPLSSKMVIKIKRDKPISDRKLITYITPQRSYDGFTIIGASICCGAFSQELLVEISNNKNVYGILFFFLLGVLLPSVLWKLKNKVVAFRGRYAVNVDSIFFLPLTALSEELIWRFFLPLLLLTNSVESVAVSICISCTDIENFSSHAKSYDAILIHLCFGLFEDPVALLEQFLPYLSNESIIYIVDLNRDSIESGMSSVLRKWKVKAVY
ncbi:hypothetical protein BSAF29S_03808 [Bacillus safensis subsp. safensis]